VSGNNRLIVEIAGVKDVDEAIKLIGETPMLEFKELNEQAATVGEDGNIQLGGDDLWKSTGLTGKQLSRATLTFDQQTGMAQVTLDLDDAGAKLFGEITKRNLGKPVAILLDGEPISVPAVITGKFTVQEAKLLATRLNSGALPVPIKLISQNRVGASLGEQSLTDSLRAGLWSLVFVALFMVVLYRLPGLTSIVALGVYTLAVLAVYKFLPVTLTLAGIAGFILSLGIGVDANVLIFARMREELKAGKTLTTSMLEGFRRSWPSIRDSHMTTFIGAFVLYSFTTSIVKGFALTLGIGVILSLITSTVITRAFLTTLVTSRLSRWRWLFS
jgi:protein-export membrane protein SecD